MVTFFAYALGAAFWLGAAAVVVLALVAAFEFTIESSAGGEEDASED